MKVYAVIDTNVLVSAMMNFESVPGRVVTEALNGDIIPILNDEIIYEYTEVLCRPRFRFNPDAVRVLLSEIKKRAVFVDAGPVDEFLPDPKDIVFYAVLMEKRKEEEAYLVTGNLKHFPVKTFVVTPREMLDILQEPGDNIW